MATTEEELISDAIDATSNEIFNEAWGKKTIVEDETGDRSVETLGGGLEGQHEADEDESDIEDETDETDETDEDEGEDAEDAVDEDEDSEDDDADTGDKPDGKPSQERDGQDKPHKPDREDRQQGRVPPGRLREQTERASKAEARVKELETLQTSEREKTAREMAELKAQMGVLTQVLQNRQQPQDQKDQPQPEKIPDILEDPEGYTAYLLKKVGEQIQPLSQQQSQNRVAISFEIAHAIHKDRFIKAMDAIQKLDRNNPVDRGTVQRIWAASNPGQALVDWHTQAETLARVGNDPAAYEERIRSEIRETLLKDPEIRKQILADLRAEAETGNGGRPRNEVRMPRSLNGASGSNRNADVDPHQYDDSDSAVFASAWR